MLLMKTYAFIIQNSCEAQRHYTPLIQYPCLADLCSFQRSPLCLSHNSLFRTSSVVLEDARYNDKMETLWIRFPFPSSVSQDSIVPHTLADSSTSSVSSRSSIDSSCEFLQRIEEQFGLVPLLSTTSTEQEKEKEIGTMSGRSSSTRSSSKPVPVAEMPRRNSLTKMFNDVQDYFTRGPIIGRTREAELLETTRELTLGYGYLRNDSYDTIEALPSGSEGRCFVKKSKTTGKLFVVKHTKPVMLEGPGDREQRDSRTHKYPNEARILMHTLQSNRGHVQLLDIVPDEEEIGRYYLWLEYCSGGDLFTQINHWLDTRRAPVPEQFLLHVFVSLADALAFIHHGLRSRGDGRYTEDAFYIDVIHGDIKVENIFLRWTDNSLGGMPEVVIGDFGVAKKVGKRNAKLNCGTPDYHAPEDVGNYMNSTAPSSIQAYLEMVDKRTTASDIYAFGQVVYQIAAKEHDPRPIGKDPTHLQISREYETPNLREAIVKCLAIDPKQRAQASFDTRLGLLPDINRFRTARNALVQRRGNLDRMEWARPKGK